MLVLELSVISGGGVPGMFVSSSLGSKSLKRLFLGDGSDKKSPSLSSMLSQSSNFSSNTAVSVL